MLNEEPLRVSSKREKLEKRRKTPKGRQAELYHPSQRGRQTQFAAVRRLKNDMNEKGCMRKNPGVQLGEVRRDGGTKNRRCQSSRNVETKNARKVIGGGGTGQFHNAWLSTQPAGRDPLQ